MAVLSDADRARVWRGLMRYWSRVSRACPISKADGRAAVDATDVWIDGHAGNTSLDLVGYNGALPQAARDNLTVLAKTELFVAVASMRASPELAKKLLGEVD